MRHFESLQVRSKLERRNDSFRFKGVKRREIMGSTCDVLGCFVCVFIVNYPTFVSVVTYFTAQFADSQNRRPCLPLRKTMVMLMMAGRRWKRREEEEENGSFIKSVSTSLPPQCSNVLLALTACFLKITSPKCGQAESFWT